MNKFQALQVANDNLMRSRAERAHRLFFWDADNVKITLTVFGVTAIILFVLAEGAMVWLYNVLERAGVFASIFKFMGW